MFEQTTVAVPKEARRSHRPPLSISAASDWRGPPRSTLVGLAVEFIGCEADASWFAKAVERLRGHDA